MHKKKTLAKIPFVFEFEYGASDKGYWAYEHMVLQLEDCVDCLTVLFPDYEFLFLLDLSCVHDRQWEDSLNMGNMNMSCSGNKPKMQETKIEQERGYLGPYRRELHPGDTQKMIFTLEDIGPFWMCHEEQEKNRHETEIERQVLEEI
jgi:hypothetical protein